MKVKFIKNYHSFKIGEVVDLDDKHSEWFISNLFAKEDCECKDSKEAGCSECEENAKAVETKSKKVKDK